MLQTFLKPVMRVVLLYIVIKIKSFLILINIIIYALLLVEQAKYMKNYHLLQRNKISVCLFTVTSSKISVLKDLSRRKENLTMYGDGW